MLPELAPCFPQGWPRLSSQLSVSWLLLGPGPPAASMWRVNQAPGKELCVFPFK